MATNEEDYFPSWLKRFSEVTGPEEFRQQVKLLVEKNPDLAASIIGFFGMMHFGYKDLDAMPKFIDDDEPATFTNDGWRTVRSIMSDWWGWPYDWIKPNIYNRGSSLRKGINTNVRPPAQVELSVGDNRYSVFYIGGFSRDSRLDEPMASAEVEVTDSEVCEEVESKNDEIDELVLEHKLFFESAMEYTYSINSSFCDENWGQVQRMMEESNNA